MDAAVWRTWVMDVLRPQVKVSSVLMLDNFDCHVSNEGQRIITENANCSVCPLPSKSTLVCQPLDVGVMGPMKQRLRTMWLADPTTPSTASAKRKLIIDRTIAAWEQLDPATIISSFKKYVPKNPIVQV